MNLEDKTNKYIQSQVEKNEEYQRSNNIFNAIKDKQEEQYQNQVELQKKQKFNDLDNLVSLINNAYETKINFKKLNDEFIKKEQKIKHDMINFKNPDALIKSITELKELENQYQIAKQTGEMIYDINSDKLNIQHKAKAMKNMYEFEAKNEVINNKFYNKLIENQDYSYVDNPYEEAFALSNNLAELSNTLNNGSYSFTKALIYGLDKAFTGSKLGLYNILNKVSLLEDKTLAKTVKEFQNVAINHNYIPLVTESDDFLSVISSPEKILSIVAESGGEVLRNIGELAIGGVLVKGAMSLAGNAIKGMTLGKYLNHMETFSNNLRNVGLATEAKYFESALGNSLSGIRQMSYNAMNNKNFRNLIGMSLLEGALRSAEFASYRSKDGTLDVKLSDFLYGSLYGALSGSGTLAMFQKNPLSNQIFKNGLRSPFRSTAFGLGSIGFAGTVEGLTESGQSVLENLAKYSDREYITAKEKSEIYDEIIQSGELGSIAGMAIKTVTTPFGMLKDGSNAITNKIRLKTQYKDSDFNVINKNNLSDYFQIQANNLSDSLDTINEIEGLSKQERSNIAKKITKQYIDVMNTMEAYVNKHKRFNFDLYQNVLDKFGNSDKFVISDYSKDEIAVLNDLFNENNPSSKYEEMYNIIAKKKLLETVLSDKDLLKDFINNKEVKPQDFSALTADEINEKFSSLKDIIISKKIEEKKKSIISKQELNDFENKSNIDTFGQNEQTKKPTLDNDITDLGSYKKMLQNLSLLQLLFLNNRKHLLSDEKIKEVKQALSDNVKAYEERKKTEDNLFSKFHNNISKNVKEGTFSVIDKSTIESIIRDSKSNRKDGIKNVDVNRKLTENIFSHYGIEDLSDRDNVSKSLDKFFNDNSVYKSLYEEFKDTDSENPSRKSLDLVIDNFKKQLLNLYDKNIANTNPSKYIKLLGLKDDISVDTAKAIDDTFYLDSTALSKYLTPTSFNVFIDPKISSGSNIANANIDVNSMYDKQVSAFRSLINKGESEVKITKLDSIDFYIGFIDSMLENNFINIDNENDIKLLQSYNKVINNILSNFLLDMQSYAKKIDSMEDGELKKQHSLRIQQSMIKIQNSIDKTIRVLPNKNETMFSYVQRVGIIIKTFINKINNFLNSLLLRKFVNSVSSDQNTTNQQYQINQAIFKEFRSYRQLLETASYSISNFMKNNDQIFNQDMKLIGFRDMNISSELYSRLNNTFKELSSMFGIDDSVLLTAFQELTNSYITSDKTTKEKQDKYNSKSKLINYLFDNEQFAQTNGNPISSKDIASYYAQNIDFFKVAVVSYVKTLNDMATNNKTKTIDTKIYYKTKDGKGNTIVSNNVVANADAFTEMYKNNISYFFDESYDLTKDYKDAKHDYLLNITPIALELSSHIFGILGYKTSINNQNSFKPLVDQFFNNGKEPKNNMFENKYDYNKSRNKFFKMHKAIFDKNNRLLAYISNSVNQLFNHNNDLKYKLLPSNKPIGSDNKILDMYNSLENYVNLDLLKQISSVYNIQDGDIYLSNEFDFKTAKNNQTISKSIDDLIRSMSVFNVPRPDGGMIFVSINPDKLKQLIPNEYLQESSIEENNSSIIGQLQSYILNLQPLLYMTSVYNKQLKDTHGNKEEIIKDEILFNYDENNEIISAKPLYIEHEQTGVGRVQQKNSYFNIQNNKLLRDLFHNNYDNMKNKISIDKDKNKVEVTDANGSKESYEIKRVNITAVLKLFGYEIDDFLKESFTKNAEEFKNKFNVPYGLDTYVNALNKYITNKQLITKDLNALKSLNNIANERLNNIFNSQANESLSQLGESPFAELSILNAFNNLPINNLDSIQDPKDRFFELYKNVYIKIDGKTTGFGEKAVITNLIDPSFASSSGILNKDFKEIIGDSYQRFGEYLMGSKDKTKLGLIELPYLKNLPTLQLAKYLFEKIPSDFRDIIKKTVQPMMYQASPLASYLNFFQAIFNDTFDDLFLLSKNGNKLSTESNFATFLYDKNKVHKNDLLNLINNDSFISKDKAESIKLYIDKLIADDNGYISVDNTQDKNALANKIYYMFKAINENDLRQFAFNVSVTSNKDVNLSNLRTILKELTDIYSKFKDRNDLSQDDKNTKTILGRLINRVILTHKNLKLNIATSYKTFTNNIDPKDIQSVSSFFNGNLDNKFNDKNFYTTKNLKIKTKIKDNEVTNSYSYIDIINAFNRSLENFNNSKLNINMKERINSILEENKITNATNNPFTIHLVEVLNPTRDYGNTYKKVTERFIFGMMRYKYDQLVNEYLKNSNINQVVEIPKNTREELQIQAFNDIASKISVYINEDTKYIGMNDQPNVATDLSSIQKNLKSIGFDPYIFSSKMNAIANVKNFGSKSILATYPSQLTTLSYSLPRVAYLLEHAIESNITASVVGKDKDFYQGQFYDATQPNIMLAPIAVDNWNKIMASYQQFNPVFTLISLMDSIYSKENGINGNKIQDIFNDQYLLQELYESNKNLYEHIASMIDSSSNELKIIYNANNIINDDNKKIQLDDTKILNVSNANDYYSTPQSIDIQDLTQQAINNATNLNNLLYHRILQNSNIKSKFREPLEVSNVSTLKQAQKFLKDNVKDNTNNTINSLDINKLNTYERPDNKNDIYLDEEEKRKIEIAKRYNEFDAFDNIEDLSKYEEVSVIEDDIIDIKEDSINEQNNINETKVDNIKSNSNNNTTIDTKDDLEVFTQYQNNDQTLIQYDLSQKLNVDSIINNIEKDLDSMSSKDHKTAIMSFLPNALNNIASFTEIIKSQSQDLGGSFIADTQTHRGYITINDNVDHMTLLHEVIHAISYWGENANTNEVININQKISNIKNKIFYHLRNNPKEMYKAGIENLDRLHYIFNTRSNNGLNNQEFLAYFLSNSQAFDYINNLSIRYERNFARKIINFFSNLVQALIKGDLTAIRTGLYGDKLIGLVRDLNRYSDPNNLPKKRLAKYFEYHDKVDQALSNLLKSAFNRDKDLPNEEKNEIYQTFLNNFRIHRLNGLFTPMIFTSGLYRKALYTYIGEIMLTIDHPITNQIVKLGMDFNLLIDGNNSLKLIKDLVNKITSRRVGLEANKQRESEASRNAYNYLFKDFPINEEEDKAIGRIAMSGISDIIRSSIVQMTKDGKLDKDKIDKFVESDLNLLKSIFENIDNREYMVNTINGAVGNKLKQMRDYHGYSDNLANYIENAIFELGSFRAYGGSTYSGYTNARQLYNDLFDPKAMQDIGLKYNTNMIKNGTNFIANANQISALDALSKIITDDDLYESFKTLNKYIANDPNKRNLVLTAMLMLGNQNDRIKNIAKGKGSRASDRFLYNNSHDGYMPNINNPEVDVQTVTTNEEAKELYDLGYRILNVKGSVAREIDKLEDINKSEHANTTKNNEAKYFIMRRVSSISLNDRYIKGTKYQGFVAKGILFNTNNDLPYDEFIKYSEQKQRERNNHRINMVNKKWQDMKQNRVTTSEYEAILGTKKYRLLPSKKMNESIFLNNVKGSDIAYELTASYYDKKQRHELTNKFYTLLIKDAKTYHDRNLKGSTTKHYVNILNDDGTIPDNKVNAFLSAEDRYYLTKMMKNNGLKHLYVNKFLIPEMFGYNDRNLNNHVSNKHPFLKKSLAVLQKGLSLFLKEYKANVIIRTPEVVTTNLISNYTTLYLKGLSLKEIESYTYQAYSELNMILDNAKEIANLNAKLDKINSTPHILTDEESNEKYRLSKLIQSLQDQIVTSPVYPLFEGGLYTNIVEDDINDAGNIDYQFIAKVSKFMSTNKNKEEMLSNILHNGLFTSKSVLYDIGTTVTRFADFGGRYALYKHLITKGESRENAIKEAREVFIDYNAPTYSGILNFMNKYGLSAFSRYWSGIQKTIANVSIDNPLRALEIAFLQFYLMPSETISILGDNILNRNLPLLLGNPDLSKIGNNMFRWNGVLNYI